jgi:hypothetical protein
MGLGMGESLDEQKALEMAPWKDDEKVQWKGNQMGLWMGECLEEQKDSKMAPRKDHEKVLWMENQMGLWMGESLDKQKDVKTAPGKDHQIASQMGSLMVMMKVARMGDDLEWQRGMKMEVRMVLPRELLMVLLMEHC